MHIFNLPLHVHGFRTNAESTVYNRQLLKFPFIVLESVTEYLKFSGKYRVFAVYQHGPVRSLTRAFWYIFFIELRHHEPCTDCLKQELAQNNIARLNWDLPIKLYLKKKKKKKRKTLKIDEYFLMTY